VTANSRSVPRREAADAGADRRRAHAHSVGCRSVSDATIEQLIERRKTVSQIEKAKQFAALHVKGTPVVLCNAWDAGSAKSIVNAGAKAIATSSWSSGGARI
jgi:hypothetical protein